MRHSKLECSTSALGHKRTFTHLRPTSALPLKADIDWSTCFSSMIVENLTEPSFKIPTGERCLECPWYQPAKTAQPTETGPAITLADLLA